MKQVTLNPIEEREFDELRRMGQKLHVPIPEAKWKLEVLMGGKIVQSYETRSHSWTRNAYNLLFSQLAGKNCDDAATFEGGKLNGRDTDGNVWHGNFPGAISRDGSADDTTYGYRASAGNDDYSILPGYGIGAENFENYALTSPIIHGTTNDGHHLSFITSQVHSISYAVLTLKNELIRFFNNNSGGSVDVKEMALVFRGRMGGVNPFNYLVTRDLLGSTVTIPDTGQLKVTYTISLTYPS